MTLLSQSVFGQFGSPARDDVGMELLHLSLLLQNLVLCFAGRERWLPAGARVDGVGTTAGKKGVLSAKELVLDSKGDMSH